MFKTEKINQTRAFKLRRAKLKRFLMDNSSGGEYVDYRTFMVGLEGGHIALTNVSDVVGYFSSHDGKISVNQIMNRLVPQFISDDDTMTVEFVVNDNINAIDMLGIDLMNLTSANGAAFKLSVAGSESEASPDMSSARAKSQNPTQKQTTFKHGYIFNDYLHHNLQKGDLGGILPRPKHLKNDLYIKPENGFTTDFDEAIAACQRNNIDYRYLYQLVSFFMKADASNEGLLSVGEFEAIFPSLKLAIPEEVLKMISTACTIVINDMPLIALERLCAVADRYKFEPVPNNVIRQRAALEQATKIPKAYEAQHILLKSDFAAMTLPEHAELLRKKLEEKCVKLTEMFKFFDKDRDGKATFIEFQMGLDSLSMRIDINAMVDLFRLIDTKRDHFIDFEELYDFMSHGRVEEPQAVMAKTTLDPFMIPPSQHISYLKVKTQNPTFSETIAADIDRSDYINPTMDNAQQSYIPMTRSPLGRAQRRGKPVVTPKSPLQPDHVFGIKSKPTENMNDIMSNGYHREYLKANEMAESRYKERHSSVHRRTDTEGNIMRHEYIRSQVPSVIAEPSSRRGYTRTPTRQKDPKAGNIFDLYDHRPGTAMFQLPTATKSMFPPTKTR